MNNARPKNPKQYYDLKLRDISNEIRQAVISLQYLTNTLWERAKNEKYALLRYINRIYDEAFKLKTPAHTEVNNRYVRAKSDDWATRG